jgi:hypothetical protein
MRVGVLLVLLWVTGCSGGPEIRCNGPPERAAPIVY